MENQRIGDSGADPRLKTIITGGTIITGEITGEGDLHIAGRFNGKINLVGLLSIEKSGSFEGQAECEHFIIEGQVQGQIKSPGKIEIRSSGQVRGKILCSKIAIAEGAFLDGEVKTLKGKPLTPTYFVEKRKNLLTETTTK
jgi:cytoskeletal protein CcmA (bactofilin family)